MVWQESRVVVGFVVVVKGGNSSSPSSSSLESVSREVTQIPIVSESCIVEFRFVGGTSLILPFFLMGLQAKIY